MSRSSKNSRRRSGSLPELKLGFSWFSAANVALLAIAISVGGASRENEIPAAIVELASLALLPWTIFRLAETDRFRTIVFPSVIILGILAIPLVQLAPLPLGVWDHLPARSIVKDIRTAAGISSDWVPMSVAPSLTLRSALSLFAPITVFLGWITLSTSERRTGVASILLLVLLGLLLGAVQLGGGQQEVGYLYRNTNLGSLVGFFSNRNHEASLLLAALPLTAGLIAAADRRTFNAATLATVCLGLTFIVIVGLAAGRSRAGVLLAGPAILASLALLVRSERLGRPRRLVLVLGCVLCIAAVLVAQFGLAPLLERFDSSFDSDLRFTSAPIIWRAALHYLPLGSGIGSFDVIYRSAEPLGMVQLTFLNHAHDDFLELLLETGFLGAAVLAGFLAWFIPRIWVVWRQGTHGSDALARAGSIVIILLMAHSAVDYPLRTMALSSVFAFCCALMISGPGTSRRVRV
jgi:O-antigen ligase